MFLKYAELFSSSLMSLRVARGSQRERVLFPHTAHVPCEEDVVFWSDETDDGES